MPIDREAIERVIGLLAEANAGEIEIEDGETTIRVVRSIGTAAPGEPRSVEVDDADEQMQTPVATEPVAPVVEEDRRLEYVTAGLVGLFHRGGGPDDEPIVEIGDEVSEGQVVATIEALRKVTDVVAPCDGVIDQFFAEDGDAVHYGDRLFAVRPQEA